MRIEIYLPEGQLPVNGTPAAYYYINSVSVLPNTASYTRLGSIINEIDVLEKTRTDNSRNSKNEVSGVGGYCKKKDFSFSILSEGLDPIKFFGLEVQVLVDDDLRFRGIVKNVVHSNHELSISCEGINSMVKNQIEILDEQPVIFGNTTSRVKLNKKDGFLQAPSGYNIKNIYLRKDKIDYKINQAYSVEGTDIVFKNERTSELLYNFDGSDYEATVSVEDYALIKFVYPNGTVPASELTLNYVEGNTTVIMYGTLYSGVTGDEYFVYKMTPMSSRKHIVKYLELLETGVPGFWTNMGTPEFAEVLQPVLFDIPDYFTLDGLSKVQANMLIPSGNPFNQECQYQNTWLNPPRVQEKRTPYLIKVGTEKLQVIDFYTPGYNSFVINMRCFRKSKISHVAGETVSAYSELQTVNVDLTCKLKNISKMSASLNIQAYKKGIRTSVEEALASDDMLLKFTSSKSHIYETIAPMALEFDIPDIQGKIVYFNHDCRVGFEDVTDLSNTANRMILADLIQITPEYDPAIEPPPDVFDNDADYKQVIVGSSDISFNYIRTADNTATQFFYQIPETSLAGYYKNISGDERYFSNINFLNTRRTWGTSSVDTFKLSPSRTRIYKKYTGFQNGQYLMPKEISEIQDNQLGIMIYELPVNGISFNNLGDNVPRSEIYSYSFLIKQLDLKIGVNVKIEDNEFYADLEKQISGLITTVDTLTVSGSSGIFCYGDFVYVFTSSYYAYIVKVVNGEFTSHYSAPRGNNIGVMNMWYLYRVSDPEGSAPYGVRITQADVAERDFKLSNATLITDSSNLRRGGKITSSVNGISGRYKINILFQELSSYLNPSIYHAGKVLLDLIRLAKGDLNNVDQSSFLNIKRDINCFVYVSATTNIDQLIDTVAKEHFILVYESDIGELTAKDLRIPEDNNNVTVITNSEILLDSDLIPLVDYELLNLEYLISNLTVKTEEIEITEAELINETNVEIYLNRAKTFLNGSTVKSTLIFETVKDRKSCLAYAVDKMRFHQAPMKRYSVNTEFFNNFVLGDWCASLSAHVEMGDFFYLVYSISTRLDSPEKEIKYLQVSSVEESYTENYGSDGDETTEVYDNIDQTTEVFDAI